MKKITHLAVAIGAALAVLSAAPASHADAPTCAPETFTGAEYDQLSVGMFKSKVFDVVGSRGVRDREHTYGGSGESMIRQWDYCEAGVLANSQAVVFGRSGSGRWVVVEIA